MLPWKDETWWEVGYWWPNEGEYGGWSKCQTKAEADEMARRLAAGGDRQRVHVRQVTARLIVREG